MSQGKDQINRKLLMLLVLVSCFAIISPHPVMKAPFILNYAF
jgi:hypothetical protein